MLIALICSFMIFLMTSSVESLKAPEEDNSVFDRESPSDHPTESSCPYSPKLRLENPIRIGAWNTQRLGKSKMGKKEVVKVIVKVMLRYDIIVIEEVVDSKSEVPYELLELLNEAAYFKEGSFDPNDALRAPAKDVYKCVLSKRLGRTRYKEQYAVYYRVDRVKLNDTYQYPDEKDIFHIEPFVNIFSTSDVERFAVVPIHTSPYDAEKEIDALTDVYDDVVEATGVRDAIILGDFNAGCDYVIGSDWSKIRLRTDPKFKWLISDHIDTTTQGTSCPYDRIVVTGENLLQFLYKESAQPFYFDEEFHIKNKHMVSQVSDHYPVEVLLGSNATAQDGSTPSVEVETGITIKLSYNRDSLLNLKESCETVFQQQKNCIDKICSIKYNNTRGEENENERESLEPLESNEDGEKDEGTSAGESLDQSTGKNEIEFRDKKEDTKTKDRNIHRKNSCGGVPHLIKSATDSLVIEFVSGNIEKALELITDLSSKHKCIFNNQASSVLKYKLNHGVLKDSSIYGNELPFLRIKTRLLCVADFCSVTVAKETTIA